MGIQILSELEAKSEVRMLIELYKRILSSPLVTADAKKRKNENETNLRDRPFFEGQNFEV